MSDSQHSLSKESFDKNIAFRVSERLMEYSGEEEKQPADQ